MQQDFQNERAYMERALEGLKLRVGQGEREMAVQRQEILRLRKQIHTQESDVELSETGSEHDERRRRETQPWPLARFEMPEG